MSNKAYAEMIKNVYPTAVEAELGAGVVVGSSSSPDGVVGGSVALSSGAAVGFSSTNSVLSSSSLTCTDQLFSASKKCSAYISSQNFLSSE